LNKIFQKIIDFYIKKNNRLLYFIFYSFFKNFKNIKVILSFSNYKFYASTQKKDLSKWMIRNLSQWDKKNLNIIIKLIKKYNSSFIDCGCNFGAYSIPIARKFKEKTIYSIDASDKAIFKLKENIKLNQIKNIKYFNFGIGSKNNVNYFDDNLEKFKNSGSFRFTKKKTKKKIKIFKLDFLYKEKKLKLNKHIVIKIDLEGYDFFALKGMREIFKKSNVIIFFEFSKLLFKNHKNFNYEFEKFLTRYKLNLYNLDFEKIKIKELKYLLSKSKKNSETIGDYIITNLKLK